MMIDTILNNIPETLTLGSVIVGGAAWLGKYWSSQLIEKVKSKSARDIESLRADYQKEIRVLDEKFGLDHNIGHEVPIRKVFLKNCR